jgi:hypothetical protein
MLSAIFMGFFLVVPLVPDELALADEQLAELLAETVHRALESGRVVSPEEAQAIAQTFTQYLSRAIEIDQQQFQHAL